MAATTVVRKVQLKITADDGNTEEKLARIQAQADKLAADHPELKVRIATAAAQAKMAVLRKELKDTGQQATQTSGRIGSLGQALNIGLLGGLSGGVSQMGMFGKAMAAVNVATGVGEPLVAGLTVSVMGLASGLAAAGAGLGVFGLVAKSALTQASTAATAAAAAQTAYGNAVAKANLTYSQSLGRATSAKQRQAAEIAHANALQSAELQRTQALNTAYQGMNKQQISLAGSIAHVKTEWQSFLAANAGGVGKVLSQGFGLLPRIFQLMQPFLAPTEHAISGLISDFSRAIAPAQKVSGVMREMAFHARTIGAPQGAGSLAKFLQLLSQNAGPAITKVGVALGHVVTGITGVLSAFMPMAQTMLTGVDKLTAKFAAWGQSLPSHSGFQSLMSMFRSDTPIVTGLVQNLAGILKIVGSELAGMNTASNSSQFLVVARGVTGLLDALLKAHPELVVFAAWGVTVFGVLGKLKTGLSGVKDGIAGVQKGLEGLQKARSAMQDFASGFGDVSAAADEATGKWGTFGGKVSSVFSSIKSGAIAAAEKLGLLKTATVEATVATDAEAGAQEGLDVAMDANPIGLIIIAVAALAAGIFELAKHSKAFRDFWKAAWRDIEHAAEDAYHFVDDHVFRPIQDAAVRTVDWIRSHWQLLFGILTGPVGMASAWVISHWHSIEAGAQRMVTNVTGFFRSLPGKILSALGDLGHLLWNAGAAIIGGFLNGIKHAWGAVTGFFGGIGSWIASHKGPIEVDRMLLVPHGKAIMGGLRAGLQLGMPDLEAQLHQVTATIAGGIGRSSGRPALAGAGYGVQRLQLEWAGGDADSALITLLKRHIRIKGGDPNVLGR